MSMTATSRASLRFLSARGRGPIDVTMADLEDYREAIFNDRLRKDPEKSWDQLVWVWNWSRLEVDGWPAVILGKAASVSTTGKFVDLCSAVLVACGLPESGIAKAIP